MSETQRTIAGLLAILPDNTSGSISPEDVRDIVETLRGDHITIYLTATSLTSIATVSVPVKALCTTTEELIPAARNFTMPAYNRITYSGPAARLVHVEAKVSFVSSANGKVFAVHIAKNGTVIASTKLKKYCALTGNIEFVSTAANVLMSPTDYVETWISNETDSNDCTVQQMVLTARGIAS